MTEKQIAIRSGGVLSYLSLFSSLGTLLCCALPSLFVLIGLGATVASLLSAVPWLVTLSRHKHWAFIVAGAMIAANFGYTYVLAARLQPNSGACPADGGSACDTASRMSRIVLWTSGTLYGIGLFAAYLLGPLLMRFGE